MDISPLRGYYAAHTPTLMGERGGSAVLVPLVRQDGEYCLLYEIRSANVRQPGEVCFPGGKREAGETAVRPAGDLGGAWHPGKRRDRYRRNGLHPHPCGQPAPARAG